MSSPRATTFSAMQTTTNVATPPTKTQLLERENSIMKEELFQLRNQLGYYTLMIGEYEQIRKELNKKSNEVEDLKQQIRWIQNIIYGNIPTKWE